MKPPKIVHLNNRIGRLLQLAKRNGELATTDPASELELLGNALAELAEERAEADLAINSAAEEREGLLLEPGSDEKIDVLDREIEKQQRRVERCDRIEPLLLGQLRNRREAYRQRHFEALTERFRSAVAEYCATLRRTLELKGEICAIREQAERSGFSEARLFFELPYLQCSDPTHFEFSVLSGLSGVQATVQPELDKIRFIKRCGLYVEGDTAGFTPDEASQYISCGVAERA